MLAIRLARIGKKNKAQYKIVLQEHTVAPGGRHVEILGSHDPHLKKTLVKEERVKFWISKGAQPSDTAYNLFVSKGIISGTKRKVKLPAKIVAETPTETMPAENKPKEAKPEEVKEVPKAVEEVKSEELPKTEEKTNENKAKKEESAIKSEEPKKE